MVGRSFCVSCFSFMARGTNASNYCSAYETSANYPMSFNPSLFIGVYAGFAVVSILFVIVRVLLITVMELKTAQIFSRQIVQSILHVPFRIYILFV